MAWIEVHQGLRQHPKMYALKERLRLQSVSEAIGACISLWLWAMDSRPDGNLGFVPDAALPDALGLHRRKGADIRSALVAVGLVDDDGMIHDWQQYAGRLLDIRAANAQRKRDRRRMSRGCPEDVPRMSRVTRQDKTRQDNNIGGLDQEREEVAQKGDLSPEGDPPLSSEKNRCNYKEFVACYHKHCPSLPQVKEITENRKRVIGLRWAKHPTWEFWQQFWSRVEKSDFLAGRSGRGEGHENWMPNLDWLLTEKHFLKVLEAGYDCRTPGQKPPLSEAERERERLRREIISACIAGKINIQHGKHPLDGIDPEHHDAVQKHLEKHALWPKEPRKQI